MVIKFDFIIDADKFNNTVRYSVLRSPFHSFGGVRGGCFTTQKTRPTTPCRRGKDLCVCV